MGKKIVGTLLAVLLAMMVLNVVALMLNARDTLAVVIGAILLILVVYASVEGIPRLRRRGLLLVVSFVVLCGSGCTRVAPGHVGIVVNQWGTDKGVSNYTARTGAFTYNPLTTSVYHYPTFMQNVVWTSSPHEGKPIDESISFTIENGMAISVDVSLGYTLIPEKVPTFYARFRSDDLSVFTHGFMRNVARDVFNEEAGKYKLEQVMGDNGPFIRVVWDRLQERIGTYGVSVEQFGIIGAPKPPVAVLAGINAKVQAQQLAFQKQNEIVQAEADAKKAIAEAEGRARSKVVYATGEARANELLANSITANLLEWRRLELQGQSIAKWNGTVPQFTGTGLVPFLNIK